MRRPVAVGAMGWPGGVGEDAAADTSTRVVFVELRQLAPIVAGVAVVALTVGGIVWLGDDRVLDGEVGLDGVGGQPPGASLSEPANDGTYGCSATNDPGAPRMSAPTGFHDEPFELELVTSDGRPVYYTLDGSYPDPVANAAATLEYDGPLTIEANTGPFPLSVMRSAFDRGQLANRRSAPRVWDVAHGPVDGGVVVRARSADLSAPTTVHDPADVVVEPDDDAREDLGDTDGIADDVGATGAADGTAAGAAIDAPVPDPVERAAGSSECVGVFFVGADLVRPELPVLHLATDPDHLFDTDTGIYLPGRIFEDYLDSDGFDARWAEQFGLVPANYRERGRAWERPFAHDLDDAVVLHHFAPGGEVTYASNLGIRIHGGWTRAFPQKSIRLYARNDYGNRTFDHAFFGDAGPEQHRRLVLRNSGNDWEWTMLLDGYVRDLISHWGVETQAFQPAALFINGEYWGVHNIRERYDRHYLQLAHGIDPDNVAIVSGYGRCCEVNTGEEGDDEPYRQLLRDLEAMDPADDATLAHVESQVDLDDLIEYLVLQLYISNTDWPQNNLKLWREKVEPDPGVGTPRDGRWRWLAYDLDFVGDLRRDHFHDAFARLGQMRSDAGTDIYADLGIPFLFDRLIQNDGFRLRFATVFADHSNTSFRSERAVAALDALTALVRDEMELHIRRWGNSSTSSWWPADSPEAWWSRIVEVQRYFQERPGIARYQASEYLGLGGSATLEVSTSGVEHGHVVVNTVELLPETPGVEDPSNWSGRYFLDVPVTLQAVAADGHRFVRWDGAPAGAPASAEGDAEVLILDLDDEVTSVTAVFEPA